MNSNKTRYDGNTNSRGPVAIKEPIAEFSVEFFRRRANEIAGESLSAAMETLRRSTVAINLDMANWIERASK